MWTDFRVSGNYSSSLCSTSEYRTLAYPYRYYNWHALTERMHGYIRCMLVVM